MHIHRLSFVAIIAATSFTAINWYVSGNIRFKLNYLHGDIQAGDGDLYSECRIKIPCCGDAHTVRVLS